MALLSRRKQFGFTIIELIVVMFIIAVLGTITASFIIKSLRDQERLQAQSLVQGQLSTAVERVAKVLRGTTTIIQAQQTSLTIRGFANVSDVAPSEISYFKDADNAWRFSVIPATGVAPNYTYDPANKKTYTLADKLTNDNNQPLFFYYGETNNLLAFPVSSASIKMVEIAPVALDKTNWLVEPVTLTTRVNLRNLKMNL